MILKSDLKAGAPSARDRKQPHCHLSQKKIHRSDCPGSNSDIISSFVTFVITSSMSQKNEKNFTIFTGLLSGLSCFMESLTTVLSGSQILILSDVTIIALVYKPT